MKSLGMILKKVFTVTIIRTIELIGALLLPLHAKLNFYYELHLKFRPKRKDIFVVTYPKSGTTWMLSILHQLTTEGDMDFGHIREEYPFIEYNFENGQDFELKDKERRIYATHLPYNKTPKGDCKYIFVVRNPADVLISGYHHDRNSLKFEGTFDDYFEQYINTPDKGKWSGYMADWVRNKQQLNILFLKYETMKSDLESVIDQVAEFCEIELDEHKRARVLERSSFAFMKAHEEKFDMNTYMIRLHGWSNTKSFMRKGKVQDERERFREDQIDQIEKEISAFNEHAIYQEYLRELKINLRNA